MELFFEHDGRSFFTTAIQPGQALDRPFAGRPYPCLLWDHDGRASTDERAALATSLVASNCRYVVSAGIGCSAWENAVDEAFVVSQLDAPEDELLRTHVMTTSHEDESADEVAFFFVANTDFAEHSFTEFLVLQLGGAPSEHAAILDAIRQRLASPLR